MKQKYDDDFEERHDAWVDGKIDAGERRVKYATWLAEAWKEFFEEGGQAQVTKAFERCGMLSGHDGSGDHELKVQGIEIKKSESSDEEGM